MSDREKLIELIRDGRACPIDRNPFDDEMCKSCKYLPDVDCDMTRLADYLIANGVTFAKDMDVPSKWISVEDRMPEEHDSIFAKLFGTEHWSPTMFRTVSDEVLVCVECEDDIKRVRAMRTKDGDWRTSSVWQEKVTHWMPLPVPPMAGETNDG